MRLIITYALETRAETKNQTNVGGKRDKVLRKIVCKTEIGRIRSQQIRESCGTQPINEWVEIRREWDGHVSRMDAERLVKISRDNISAGRSPGGPKRRWSDLILD